MKFCMQCGHELGASRTCASCGTTAPVEPLPAPQLPPTGVRYPLFADEVDSVTVNSSGRVLAAPVDDQVLPPAPPSRPSAPSVPPSSRPASGPATGPATGSATGPAGAEADETELRLPAVPVVPPGRRGVGPVWLALVGLVLVVFALGGWLLLRGGPSDAPQAGHGSASAHGADGADGGRDLASTARASAPVTRPPGVDTAGRQTNYAASNMLDGDPSTAWEMPGDGTGEELTFTLAASTHLTRVGLVNGYAKTGERGDTKVDWYAGNRRVLKVEWRFDDGSSVVQDLGQTRALQSTGVDVTTRTVTLRLVEVSGPGRGPAGRNMTPISDVALVGTSA